MSDLISRKAAIDAISSMFAPTPTQKDMVEDCLEIIENLPSVEPKTGRWAERESYASGELFLTLNEAVEVAVNQLDIDSALARQEFEQKCYIPCSDYENGFYDGLAKCRNIIEDAMSEGVDD